MNLVGGTIRPTRGAGSGKERPEQRPVCHNGDGSNGDAEFHAGPDGEVGSGEEKVWRGGYLVGGFDSIKVAMLSTREVRNQKDGQLGTEIRKMVLRGNKAGVGNGPWKEGAHIT